MDYIEFELNASEKGWNCSGCGLFVDPLGRPIFGNEVWVISSKGTAWLENKPQFLFCPKCGKPVRRDQYGTKSTK